MFHFLIWFNFIVSLCSAEKIDINQLKQLNRSGDSTESNSMNIVFEYFPKQKRSSVEREDKRRNENASTYQNVINELDALINKLEAKLKLRQRQSNPTSHPTFTPTLDPTVNSSLNLTIGVDPAYKLALQLKHILLEQIQNQYTISRSIASSNETTIDNLPHNMSLNATLTKQAEDDDQPNDFSMCFWICIWFLSSCIVVFILYKCINFITSRNAYEFVQASEEEDVEGPISGETICAKMSSLPRRGLCKRKKPANISNEGANLIRADSNTPSMGWDHDHLHLTAEQSLEIEESVDQWFEQL